MIDIHELREQLAAIEHERWAHWQRWMHSQADFDFVNNNMSFPPERWQAWERQIDTPYAELSAAEQASDMEQVDRYWPLIEEYIKAALSPAPDPPQSASLWPQPLAERDAQ